MIHSAERSLPTVGGQGNEALSWEASGLPLSIYLLVQAPLVLPSIMDSPPVLSLELGRQWSQSWTETQLGL